MYEKRLRSYMESAQCIPLGGYAPYLFIPQTIWGIWLLRTIMRFISWIVRFVSWTNVTAILPGSEHVNFDLEISELIARVA